MNTTEFDPLDLEAMLGQLSSLKEDILEEEQRIPISQIDDTLQIYRENKVVLYGFGTGSQAILLLIENFKIPIFKICSQNPDHWNKLVNNIPVISPTELEKLNKKTNIVVQISTFNALYDDNPEETAFLKSIGISNIICSNEAMQVLSAINKYEMIKKFPDILENYETYWHIKKSQEKNAFMDYFLYNMPLKQHIFLCMTQKTGDNTLKNTLKKYDIRFHFIYHVPEAFHRSYCESVSKPIKVFTALREPISKDLSALYETISLAGYNGHQQLYHADSKHHPLYQGGDAQEIFDLRFDNPKQTGIASTIGEFMSRFQENIMDLSKHPFDKEKGYSIMTEGNIQVFVYQLERMNDIAKEVSDFIGEKEFSSWVMGNEAKDKWISKSYKEAKKKLRISQAYFDQVYECPWLKHFYSEEDIERFKSQWQDHIDPTK